MIEAQIGGNAINPGVKGALEPKPCQMYIGAQESFLINILTIFLGAGEMNGKAEDRPVILLNELLESCGIALLRCPNQLVVVHVSGTTLSG